MTEHSDVSVREGGSVATEKPPVSYLWTDLLFGMVSGILIGGLTPTAVCYFVPAKAMTTENVCIVLILVPPAAILGGIIGMWYEWSRACRLRP